jgi:outer membrane protein OmpA-like peptidoglycan-associated protein
MATEVQDDYLDCGAYQAHTNNTSATHKGFITFEQNGDHFFAWVNGDQIVLRSEAYPDAEKMERGINAILKNCDLSERYSVEQADGGNCLVLWGGGNHQEHTGNREQHSEIGRSCPHKTREELNALLQFKGSDFANKVVPIGSAQTAKVSTEAATTLAAAATAATVIHETVKPVEEVAKPIVEAAKPVVETVTKHVESFTETKSTVNNATNYTTDVAETTGGGTKWLLPLLLLAALGFLGWWLMGKGCNKTTVVDAPVADTSKPAATVVDTSKTATLSTAANVAESTKVSIAGGVELAANKGGIEEKLVAFLNDTNAKVDTANKSANWYDFDNLNFDLGKSTITAASMVQVNNLVAILKAYPGLKIKIGGYTDKKGDDKANMTLSQSRADAVLAALKAGGANAAQITKAEGYGETLATVAESASDEERRKDRRTSVKVVSK